MCVLQCMYAFSTHMSVTCDPKVFGKQRECVRCRQRARVPPPTPVHLRDIRASRVSLCDEYAVNNPLLQLMASIKQDQDVLQYGDSNHVKI
jgi:hypothetical protein